MLEVSRGGNPDRFVKQYEGLTFVLNTPYQTKYPMMPEGPGAPTVKCGWGYYNSWPAGTPGAFPLHDPEHLVCPDVAEWKKYVKAQRVGNTYLYTPSIKESEYKRSFMSGVVRNYFENSYKEMVSFFAKDQKISTNDLKEIIDMIEKGQEK